MNILDAKPARRIVETGGPTVLTLGAVPDGDVLERSGSTVVGTPAGSGGIGDVSGSFGNSTGEASGGGGTVATFDTEVYKTTGITHSTSVNPSRIGVTTTGKYLIWFNTQPFAHSAVTIGYGVNGTLTPIYLTNNTDATNFNYASFAIEIAMNGGDYVEFYFYSPGGNVNVTGGIRRMA